MDKTEGCCPEYRCVLYENHYVPGIEDERKAIEYLINVVVDYEATFRITSKFRDQLKW